MSFLLILEYIYIFVNIGRGDSCLAARNQSSCMYMGYKKGINQTPQNPQPASHAILGNMS